MRCFWSSILVLLLAWPLRASADEESATEGAGPDSPDEREAAVAPAPPRGFSPPGIDYPQLQSVARGISLYVDQTYETTNDLSTFWWVRGRGRNYRVAVGGIFQIGDVDLHVEVPIQYTQLSIDSLMGLPPTDADQTKAAFSLGDIITGATYWWDSASRGGENPPRCGAARALAPPHHEIQIRPHRWLDLGVRVPLLPARSPRRAAAHHLRPGFAHGEPGSPRHACQGRQPRGHLAADTQRLLLGVARGGRCGPGRLAGSLDGAARAACNSTASRWRTCGISTARGPSSSFRRRL